MRPAISNIAWGEDQEEEVYAILSEYEGIGLEIAPTRIIKENPYDNLRRASEWYQNLKKQYGFAVPSMQSIWYGRTEKLFGDERERSILLEYTKKAILFAEAVGCGNLVFGCPKNRNLPEQVNPAVAVPFFRELAEYALAHHTKIGMEANPPLYQTNYINDTPAALQLIREVDHPGFGLNLDVGTMLYNGEKVDILMGNVKYVNHVHISEPGLKPIEEHELHKELLALLKKEGYAGYLSIEMGRTEDSCAVRKCLAYLKGCMDEIV